MLARGSVASTGQGISTRDTVTSQRINYKIANAYIAQDKLDEAIPYLEKVSLRPTGTMIW